MSGMSFSVEFKLVYGDSYPPELTSASTKYSSVFRVQSNTLTFSGSSPDMTMTGFSSLSESPNFYPSATNVGSEMSSSYTLSGSWGSNLNTPFVYISFRSAGPVPVYSFCSDSNTFLQCRVYTGVVNVMVAQLKSTSANSFSLSNGASVLKYPSSQFSISSQYNALIYVGTSEWYYSTSISRNINSLTPISTNTFKVYSDKYGSSKSNYAANMFLVFNPAGQALNNYVNTGSKLVITWSGVSTLENCQVWVEG